MVSFRSHLAGAMTLLMASHAATGRQPPPGRTGRSQWWKVLVAFGFILCLRLHAQDNAPTADPLLQPWFQAQTNLHSWTADVTQIRSLKTLTQPLVTQGRVWFAAPNRFRWELGHPPRTIAVRQPEQMLVIYPNLKRIERYRWQGNPKNPWRETLALLEAGFPRDKTDWERRFQLLRHQIQSGLVTLVFQPTSAGARRMMPKILIEFTSKDYNLQAMELHFADGSILRNEFQNARRNVALADDLFCPPLDPLFKIVDPLNASGNKTLD